jgi:hypothetical protein
VHIDIAKIRNQCAEKIIQQGLLKKNLDLLPTLPADDLFGNAQVAVVCTVAMHRTARKPDLILAR